MNRRLPLQGRSHRFKSCSAHKSFSEIQPFKIQKTPQFIHIRNVDIDKIKL